MLLVDEEDGSTSLIADVDKWWSFIWAFTNVLTSPCKLIEFVKWCLLLLLLLARTANAVPILDVTDDEDLDGFIGSSRCWDWLLFIVIFRFLFDVDEIPDGDDVWAEINDDDEDKPIIIFIKKTY